LCLCVSSTSLYTINPDGLMTFRRSLRKKLVYTFLAGSMLTILLFSLVIKGIMNDYFRRLGEVRLQFVSEQGQRETRTNVAIFKNEFQNIFSGITSTISTLSQSGVIGDRLPKTEEERYRMAELLRRVQRDAKLSMITIVDIQGRTILRANNPDAFGDDMLIREYDAPQKPVSSIRRLVLNALTAHTIESFETFPPQILGKENLDKLAVVPLKSSANVPVPPNTFEERGLLMTVAMPIRSSSGKIVGAILAGRMLNKDLSIVQDIQKLLGDAASIFLDDVRIATTVTLSRGANKGQNATGTLIDAETDRVLSRGEYLQRTVRINGERRMGFFEPLRNYENQVIGAIWVGRPLTFIDSIDSSQAAIEAEAGSRTNIYIIVSAMISLLVAVAIASFFSKRVTARIDQLGKGAAVIEKGQLDYRLRIDSGDEIELLSKQFNSMASKLAES